MVALPDWMGTRASWAALGVLLGACATRELPSRYPEHAAASPGAFAPPPHDVTRSLEGEPPFAEQALPAGAAERDGDASGAHPHGHGAHHHGQ